MRRRVLVIAATATALCVPAGAAGAAQLREDSPLRILSGDVSAQLISGKLPNGAGFTLPPVGQPPFPAPASLPGLPGSRAGSLVEPSPAYVAQTSCDPGEKSGLTAFKKLVMSVYTSGEDWGSSRNCTDDGISEHLEGRAWDFHMDVNNATQFAQAGQLLTWLTADAGANARRFGIMYIGYNHRIWGAYRASEGWRLLSNSNPHTDHIHFSFTWNGATKNTSFWTGAVAATDYGPCRLYSGQPAPLRTGRNTKPCPAAVPLPSQWKGAKLLWRGSTGALVTTVQQKLAVSPASGTFGAVTGNAVAAFQRRSGIPATGAVDAQTWFALGMGTPGPVTKAGATRALSTGMTGADVRRLQRALKLKVKYRTGKYTARTRKAVRRWQRAHHWKVTGVASLKMQRRLGL